MLKYLKMKKNGMRLRVLVRVKERVEELEVLEEVDLERVENVEPENVEVLEKVENVENNFFKELPKISLNLYI